MNKYLILIILSVIIISGCTKNINIANNNITIKASTNTNKTYQEKWQELKPGLNFRELPVYSESDKKTLVDVVTIFKFDSKKYKFELKQNIQKLLTVSEWADKHNALFTVNGSYFDEDNQPTTLVRIDGKQSGVQLGADSVGGVVIDENGLLKIFTNANINQYNNILQSYPLLIRPDKEKSVREDSGKTAPRSVVAKDKNGNVLFIFTQSYYFTLYKLEDYLKKSDLDLKIALNLDGGPSSGYYLNSNVKKISETSEVPNVIMVKNK